MTANSPSSPFHPPLSIIIPAHNAADTLPACLHALENQTVPSHRYEVIVVDDGSTDDTAEVVRQFTRPGEVTGHAQRSARSLRPDGRRTTRDQRSSFVVKLIRQARQGPAGARNAGVQAARGDLILFLDADCVPERDWVERMTQALQRGGVAGVSGMVQTRQRGLIARFVQAEYDMRYERIARQPYIDFVSSATAGYHRQAFTSVGGFAAELGGAEDAELSFRLAEAGYRLVLEPRAVVYHPHPESLIIYTRRKVAYAYWRARVYQRHPRRAAQDSRTPFSQKLQIALVPLIGVATAAGARWPAARRFAGGLMGGFLLTTLPFAVRVGRRDLLVGLITPLASLLGAAAGAVGLTFGLVHNALSQRRRAIGRD